MLKGLPIRSALPLGREHCRGFVLLDFIVHNFVVQVRSWASEKVRSEEGIQVRSCMTYTSVQME